MISHDLSARARHLHTAGAELPLPEVLELTGRLCQDADCLAAVAVDAARQRGQDWQEVASAARLSEASARARWGGVRASRLVAARVPLPSARPAYREPPAPADGEFILRPAGPASCGAAQALGAALRTLHERSAAGLSRVSSITDLPLPVLTSVLEGRTVAPWSVIYMLAHALGGEPQELRWLWQHAWGQPAPGDVGDSPERLRAALCGARLAAGLPDLAASCPPDRDVAEVRAVFDGQAVPDWPVVSHVLTVLGADLASFESLWAEARAAQLAAREGDR
ncbi:MULTISPECIES: hypothetical protein [Streptomyces]|uniref:Uncharacterized protein n=2 Tax=Streptomyces TaxID=1883 RepID=A0A124ECX9_9ACTN|nr:MULTISPECIES: hypothetical protein [Streptomyces]KUH39051.1 hypothetical protein ATE80_09585 [Streptomyces kanasensis]UUS34621.1 hypothetical protein NRO40_29955 [Streptomyces changanensis]